MMTLAQKKSTSWIQKLSPLKCEGGGGNRNNINGQIFGSRAHFGLFPFLEDKIECLPSKSSRSGWWTLFVRSAGCIDFTLKSLSWRGSWIFAQIDCEKKSCCLMLFVQCEKYWIARSFGNLHHGVIRKTDPWSKADDTLGNFGKCCHQWVTRWDTEPTTDLKYPDRS